MKTTKKFTLLELLMVMAVIAMLAALIMPAIGFVQRSAQKTKTRSQISALYLAIKQYESIYGALPLTLTSDPLIVTSQYPTLIKSLCPKTTDNSIGNSRGISFLVPNADFSSTSGFIDMWKHDLKVIMTSSATITKGGTGGLVDTVYSNVAVWSVGPNGRDDKGSTTTPGDDITSWK